MTRAPRLHRTAILAAERRQAMVIAALVEQGDNVAAGRLVQCQAARFWRTARWPRSCRSGGCWACRRALLGVWWTAIIHWAGTDASMVVIPNSKGSEALRRSMRDWRDQRARRCRSWRDVAFAGFAGTDHAVLMVVHPGVDLLEVQANLERRWRGAVVRASTAACPTVSLSLEDEIRLATRRRGIQPMRIMVMPQRRAPRTHADDLLNRVAT